MKIVAVIQHRPHARGFRIFECMIEESPMMGVALTHIQSGLDEGLECFVGTVEDGKESGVHFIKEHVIDVNAGGREDDLDHGRSALPSAGLLEVGIVTGPC